MLIISLIVSAFISYTPAFVYGAAAEEEVNGEQGDTPVKNNGKEDLENGGEAEAANPDDKEAVTGEGETPSTDNNGIPSGSQGEALPVIEEKTEAEKNAAVVRLDISPEPITVIVNTSIALTVKGYDAGGSEVEIPQHEVIWSIKTDGVPEIGKIAGGTLTAGEQPATGVVAAEYGGLTTEVTVNVKAPPAMQTAVNSEWAKVFEDFEDMTDLRVTTVAANSAGIDPVERPNPVKYGLKAGRLTYDFTDQGGTSAAYIRFKAPDGKDGREISGSPKKIGFWVYGEDKKHWIRGQIQDGKGALLTIDFTGSSEVLNGWRYVTADIPSSNYPIKLNYIYLVETGTKTAGTLYVDQVSMIYEDTNIFGLEWSGVKPLGIGETVKASALITRKGDSSPQPADSGIVTFSSIDETVATIDPSGMITALAAGETELIATYQNKYAAVYRLVVSLEPAQPERILIEGPSSLVLTETANLKAFAVFGDGEPVDVSAEATFEVEADNAVAEITGQQIRALQVGGTMVKAKYEGHEASYTVQVKAGELKTIEIGDVFSAIVGEDVPAAKVYGDYKVEGKKEITSGITFGSMNTNIATIDPATGKMTAIAPGTTMITAEVSGKKAQQLLVVTKPAAHPKRELRGAWISTVENIDWPTKNVIDPEQQRQDFVKLLDQLKQTGINAVFVQIRPTSDSFFPSEYFPWSHWLTGEQGKAPSDGYDPLKFMIDEAHKRNLEFHGWINPYRISMHDKPELLSTNHPARLHPDWVVKNGGKLYFNPAIPEAQNYIIDGVKEIVQKYDVDGIHMDDYFYPYPGNEPFDDTKEYNAYKSSGGTMTLDNWRRDNVNTIVKGLNTAIKHIKPYVKFGISPFGIWRNKGTDPTGSDTNGQQNYDGLYADTRTWMKEGWVDYLAPQIYWHFGYSAAAYEKLIDWWTKEINGINDNSGKHNVQLYIGQAAYRVGEDNWKNPDQLPAQLRFNNDHGEDVAGNIMFSTSDLLGNPLGVRDVITSMYSRPALIPVMSWLPDETPDAPKLTGAEGSSGSIQLSWTDIGDKEPAYYAVYRVQDSSVIDPTNTSQLIATVRRAEGVMQVYKDLSAAAGQEYTYAVSGVSRLHHESGLSNTLAGHTEASDFTAIELGKLQPMTVSQTQQVKVYGILHSGEKQGISEGVTFTSSEPKAASVNEAGLITALAEGSTLIKAEFQGNSASYTLDVQAAATTNPGTQTPSTGPGTPSTLPTEPPVVQLNQRVVSDHDLNSIRNDKLDIEMESGQTQVLLPSSAPDRLGKGGILNIHTGGAVLSIPSSILQEAAKLVAGANSNELKLIVDVKSLAADVVSSAIKQLQQSEDAELTASLIIQVGISAQTNDGKQYELKHFSDSVILTLDIPAGVKPARTGIYRITGSKAMEYAGGKRIGEKQVRVGITTPGQYSAIAYDKTFRDIASNHWASEVIKDMAARHVVNGLPDGSFAPDKPVSRAEFASMLTRMLSLPAGNEAVFTDVRDDSWYTKDIAAAVEAGIIHGSGDGQFHPERAVTREEMTVMLLNAFVAAGGKKPGNITDTAFKDQSAISKWAQQAINDAVGMGLLQGSDGKFNPAQKTKRSESAQALANLLKFIEKLS
ncbi:family 10 glycosylhydrolase [Paenibacillus sp. J23TS9]|uniref:family 10 glycosylhydrolase n=1 Tax=Paenibacillus sp. J23TS9 TaxID=2807193 RepID=UPI001BCF1FA8|nr:family 10 glycosylhydrolase [Paenibacillus sp. J23TS9]